MQLVYKIQEYINSLIPNQQTQIEAERRYLICLNCEQFKLRDNAEICNICGCRLMNQAFNPEPQCPLNKH